jgi:hypothetical protein
LSPVADKKQMLLQRAKENEMKAQLASDAKVKQTFLDLAQAYRNMAFDVELLFSLREKAGLVSRAARKNT